MANIKLAGRYAKSLIDLSTEKNQLEQACADMKYILAVSKSSREFVNVLRSPIIKADKKQAIFTAVLGDSIGALTLAFLNLLAAKGRESELVDIAKAFVEQYNTIKGIHQVKLTTAAPVTTTTIDAIVNMVKQERGFNAVEVETKVDEALIGGFVLEFDNNIVDASILRDLNDVKKQFSGNMYIQNIR
jgi:F-type H+-transporting ATPase subunit delta